MGHADSVWLHGVSLTIVEIPDIFVIEVRDSASVNHIIAVHMERWSLQRCSTSMKARLSGGDVMDRLAFLSKRIQDLEAALSTKNKEIARVEQVNKQLVTGLQKRDEIIASALEENRKLKENLRWYQRLLAQTKKGKEDEIGQKTSLARGQKRSFQRAKDAGPLATDNAAKRHLFEELVMDDHGFVERFTALEPYLQRDWLETVRKQQEDYCTLVDLTLRLKRLVLATHTISSAISISDAFDKLVAETCETIRCDRAAVFLVDELNGELWSKSAKGLNQMIRIPLDKGIVGYVAMSGKPVNIEDAYKDSRFNKTVDLQTNYRTKSILALPMRDFSGKVMGVCEAVNKHEGVFTPDDEGLLEMLALSAGAVMRSTLHNEKAVSLQQRYRDLLATALELGKLQTLSEFMSAVVKCTEQLLSVNQVYFYVVREEALLSQRSGIEECMPIIGLVGQCIAQNTTLNIANAYEHPDFHKQVDIETSLPVIVMPVRMKQGRVLAVLELVNPKGVYGRSATNKAKIDHLDNEVLMLLHEVLLASVERLLQD